MRHKQIKFRGSCGSRDISAQIWLPDAQPLALVQVAHEMNGHGGRYADFARWLTERGLALAVHDQMGHGLTAGERENLGYFAPQQGWLHALADIRRFSALLRTRYPHTPLFLLGQSMGSFMARDILIRYEEDYQGVILCGTRHNPGFQYLLGIAACDLAAIRHGRQGKSRMVRDLCMGGYARQFAGEGNAAAWLSRDRAAMEAYARDAYCRFIPSIAMFREVFRGMRHMDCPRYFRCLRQDLPLLLVSGSDDAVGGRGKNISRLYRRLHYAGLKDVELLLYPGGRHEMLHEVNKYQVYADIFDWLRERMPQPADGN